LLIDLVSTLRRECLDHLVVVNEAHRRSILAELVRYRNAERPHRALELETPLQQPRRASGPIRARPVLGGLSHLYERAA
jgi:transposase InsO family protein